MKRKQMGELVIGSVVFILLSLGVLSAAATQKTSTADAETVKVAESK